MAGAEAGLTAVAVGVVTLPETEDDDEESEDAE